MPFRSQIFVLLIAIALAVEFSQPACAIQPFDASNQQQSYSNSFNLGDYLNAAQQPLDQPSFNAYTFPSSGFDTKLIEPPVSGRPRGIPIGLQSEWLSDPDAGLVTAGMSIKAPLLRGFGSPPPIVKIGFDYTNLFAADRFGLPDDLFVYSIGVSGVRRINDRWAVRTMLGTAFATDHDNTSSDSWQFRGGAFGIYKRSPQWSWTIGAIALGRSDLPVLPAVGAIWQPTMRNRFDLTLPTMKYNYLLSDDGHRQQWTYVGIGLSGTTWGYEQIDGTNDQLSYGDWRVLAGWKSRPTPPPGKPFAIGRKNAVSIGYAFSRDLEFENETVEVPLSSTFLIRVSTSY